MQRHRIVPKRRRQHRARTMLVLLILKMIILLLPFVNGLRSTNNSKNHKNIYRVETLLMGESALIDKETGQVYWEDNTSNTLFESMEPKIISLLFGGGRYHVKASLLSGLLFLLFIGFLISTTMKDHMMLMLSNNKNNNNNGIHTIISSFLFHFILKIVLMIPKSNPCFILCIYILYLFEAYTSSTRQYLCNIIPSTVQLEEYIDVLKCNNNSENDDSNQQQQPIIEWKVRCYHYTIRSIYQPIIRFYDLMKSNQPLLSTSNNEVTAKTSSSEPFNNKSNNLLYRKCISQVYQGCYNYDSCMDNTIMAIWKRATTSMLLPDDATTSTDQNSIHPNQQEEQSSSSVTTSTSTATTAPITKIILSKTIVLSDQKTKQDYIQQQNDFVSKYSQVDAYSEFSTNIIVHGFKPRILALTYNNTNTAAKNNKLLLLSFLCTTKCFWLCTIFGLTVPYRIMLSRYCDVVRLIIVKEIKSSNNKKKQKNKKLVEAKLLDEGFNNNNADKSKIDAIEAVTIPATDYSNAATDYTISTFRSIMQKLMLKKGSAIRLSSTIIDEEQLLLGSDEELNEKSSSQSDVNNDTNATAAAKALLQEGLEAATIMADLSQLESKLQANKELVETTNSTKSE